MQLIKAAGRKKSKLIFRAVRGSNCMTIVSQSINKLPPPMPKPVRNPKTVLTNKVIGKLRTIDTEILPIKSECLRHDAEI